MYFAILGPLEVRYEDSPLPIGGAKRRALLIALLASANRIVPVDQLMLWLWPGKTPPRSAGLVIQAHISSLRTLLEPLRPPRTEAQLLLTISSGYQIQINPDQLDALQFELLVTAGTRLMQQNEPGPAAEVLHHALALWRGAALCDVHDLPAAQSEIARLDELRLMALVQHNEVSLRMGRFMELVPQLTVQITEFPYHERFYAQLMTALAGCGRRAEALAIYQRARKLLAEELGVEPGPELRAVESAILHGDA